jgi:hypothetical protein
VVPPITAIAAPLASWNTVEALANTRARIYYHSRYVNDHVLPMVCDGVDDYLLQHVIRVDQLRQLI